MLTHRIRRRTVTLVSSVLLVLQSLVVLGPGAAPAWAGDDRRIASGNNEPHNATVNPRRPSQVAVMQGCTVHIDLNWGRDGFPITRTSTVAPCNGDPSLAFDADGRLFVTHLSRGLNTSPNQLGIGVARIADTTTTGNQTYTPVQVSANGAVDHDKQWLVVDANPVSPYVGNLYLVWTEFNGANTRILFSRSVNAGTTWSAAAALSVAAEGFVWPSHAAVARNGDLYVAYHTNTCGAANTGTVQLLRDGSGGADFAAGTVPQKSAAFPAGQATVTCNVQSGTATIPGTDFWLQGSVQPWILPDPARAGHVYVIGNDDPDNAFGTGDDADVVIARSTDNGLSFTRGRVDHGPGRTFAVMPTAHIDQDGNIAVTWYDNRSGRRNGGNNFLLEVYGTASRDGGQTFAEDFRIGDEPFDPDLNAPCRFDCGAGSTNRTLRIGEYNGVWAVDGIGYASWTGNRTPPTATAPAQGVQDTYFDVFSLLAAFPDAHEPNESADHAVAADLGSNEQFNRRGLTLHSATDVDFFRITPRHTGHVTAEIRFNEVLAPLAVRAYDKFGNRVAAGTVSTRAGTSTGRLAIPVVQDETYLVVVSAAAVTDPTRPGDASPTDPPQGSYDLVVVGRTAPEPFALDLARQSDSGRSDRDDVTRIVGPDLQLRVDDAELRAAGVAFSPQNATATLADDVPGFKVAVERDGEQVGFASPTARPGLYEIRLDPVLREGPNQITAEVVVVDPSDDPRTGGTGHVVGSGPESAHALLVTLDTTAPARPATAPDLLASSDSGGVDSDDVTTLVKPAFQGSAVEPNALVRLLATPAGGTATVVGKDVVTPAGEYEVVSSALRDGRYGVAVLLEDLAGNVSASSAALPVTIAHQSLTLTGATADVVADLAEGRVTGFPGVPGGVVGIQGIPVVNLDAAGHGASVRGGSADDRLTFTPTAVQSGRLTRADSAQVLNFSHVTGEVGIATFGGDDEVTIVGTTRGDVIRGVVDTFTTLHVGALPLVRTPSTKVNLLGLRIATAQAERIGVLARGGQDKVEFLVKDSVSAHLSVHGGPPTGVRPEKGDSLLVYATSPRAVVKTDRPEHSTSGAIYVAYPETTKHQTRIDFTHTESTDTSTHPPKPKTPKNPAKNPPKKP
ncbi:Ig-like domain-containing protein [Streptomyces bambusae]|uniref:Ig-like domain-containing protein n=1 Tax=Streptomyces bambusae TaxID=1550616 RepID=UPI001CFFAF98|nr:Ig-like domain-containing protein [Streptomyces bambusae]MCB5169241.1 Ig-like domain-containing protein [Streptomyces bambusae]